MGLPACCALQDHTVQSNPLLSFTEKRQCTATKISFLHCIELEGASLNKDWLWVVGCACRGSLARHLQAHASPLQRLFSHSSKASMANIIIRKATAFCIQLHNVAYHICQNQCKVATPVEEHCSPLLSQIGHLWKYPQAQAQKWICQLFINFQILSKFHFFPHVYSAEELQSCATECQLFIKPNFASSQAKTHQSTFCCYFVWPQQIPE